MYGAGVIHFVVPCFWIKVIVKNIASLWFVIYFLISVLLKGSRLYILYHHEYNMKLPRARLNLSWKIINIFRALTFQKQLFDLLQWKPYKMKNPFYFMVKALFVLKIFKLSSSLFADVENGLVRNMRLIDDVSTWLINNYSKHIFHKVKPTGQWNLVSW